MLDPTIDFSILEPAGVAHGFAVEGESSKTLAILEELLAQSIRLRDLYKTARLHVCGPMDDQCYRLFDGHYREQIHLVDVLIDRMRALGGAGMVFAADLLGDSQFHQSRRGRMSVLQILRELLDAHELVLSIAMPTGANAIPADRSWTRDFAVGQVVLTNTRQYHDLSDSVPTKMA